MWIKIEPLDVLLFRESKPFSAGENFRAAGRFPPSSLPLVGAIRSRALAHPHLKVDVQTYVDCAR
jgi:CRISPR-associated protein Cmr3